MGAGSSKCGAARLHLQRERRRHWNLYTPEQLAVGPELSRFHLNSALFDSYGDWEQLYRLGSGRGESQRVPTSPPPY